MVHKWIARMISRDRMIGVDFFKEKKNKEGKMNKSKRKKEV